MYFVIKMRSTRHVNINNSTRYVRARCLNDLQNFRNNLGSHLHIFLSSYCSYSLVVII